MWLAVLGNITLVNRAHGGDNNLVQALRVSGNGPLGGVRIPKSAEGSRSRTLELATHAGSRSRLAGAGSAALLLKASLENRSVSIMKFP